MSEECIRLESLKNTSRCYKKRKLLGRGVGSKKGKTCGRGHKGAGSRSGYKRRYGAIGGGVPLHKKVPTRGFSHVRFAERYDVINLDQIDAIFNAGDVVSLDSLKQKGLIRGHSYGVKVLGNGSLTKKVKFEVAALSESAKEKLKAAGIPF